MTDGASDLLGGLLKDVSRSFYLTLRILPARIRRQIGLAYLLARASDTIADTDAVGKDQRLEVLQAFLERVRGRDEIPLDLNTLAGSQSSPSERVLLRRLEEAITVLRRFDRADQILVQDVLGTIISGQVLDVKRFADAGASHIAALEDDDELDDYVYRVAGCVGEFWTRMCRAHLFPTASVDDAFLLANGIRFGKGLQLVNVLRDLPADLRNGRCYLPRRALRLAGLEPADLLEASNEQRLRPVYSRYLKTAEEHLDAGWEYTNHLPFRSVRVRLACAWPILIGVQTLSRLRQSNVLDPAQRIRIDRTQVRQLLVRSVLWYPWPGQWRRLAERSRHAQRNTLPETPSFVK